MSYIWGVKLRYTPSDLEVVLKNQSQVSGMCKAALHIPVMLYNNRENIFMVNGWPIGFIITVKVLLYFMTCIMVYGTFLKGYNHGIMKSFILGSLLFGVMLFLVDKIAI